jgi:hypothetical protein
MSPTRKHDNVRGLAKNEGLNESAILALCLTKKLGVQSVE